MVAMDNLYQCGVCAYTCSSVIPLSGIHQVLIETLYNVFKIYINPNGFPKVTCKNCLDKIEVFDNLIGDRGRKHLYYVLEEDMLRDLDSNGKEGISETHNIDCQCEICSQKYGLQLLADVIEQKESEQMENVTVGAATNPTTPEPSTSEEVASSSRRTKHLKCSYCAKVFSHRGDMNKHLRMHTGEQPFQCHICQRKFKHTSNLRRHLTVHSGIKPFTCDMCGKKFNRKDKMESHRRTRLCKKHSSSLQEEIGLS